MARYHEIADDLERRIRAGEYTDRLPSLEQLVSKYAVAINTVRAAERILEEKGLVRIAQGEGVYIENPPEQDSTAVALSAIEDAQRALEKAMRVLKSEKY